MDFANRCLHLEVTRKHPRGTPGPHVRGTHTIPIRIKGFLWEWYGSSIGTGVSLLGGSLKFPLIIEHMLKKHEKQSAMVLVPQWILPKMESSHGDTKVSSLVPLKYHPTKTGENCKTSLTAEAPQKRCHKHRNNKLLTRHLSYVLSSHLWDQQTNQKLVESSNITIHSNKP